MLKLFSGDYVTFSGKYVPKIYVIDYSFIPLFTPPY